MAALNIKKKEYETVIDTGTKAGVQLLKAQEKVKTLLDATRKMRADEDPPTSCTEVLAKIDDLSTASSGDDLPKVLAVATRFQMI